MPHILLSLRIGLPRNERIQNERLSLLALKRHLLVKGVARAKSSIADLRLKLCMNLLIVMFIGARITMEVMIHHAVRVEHCPEVPTVARQKSKKELLFGWIAERRSAS